MVPSLSTAFHARMHLDGETLADYSRVLMRLHSHMEKATATEAEGQALALLRDNALKEQFSGASASNLFIRSCGGLP